MGTYSPQTQPKTGPAASHCYAGFSPEFVDSMLEREEARHRTEVAPEAALSTRTTRGARMRGSGNAPGMRATQIHANRYAGNGPDRNNTSYMDTPPYRDSASNRDTTQYRDNTPYRDSTAYRDTTPYWYPTSYRGPTPYRGTVLHSNGSHVRNNQSASNSEPYGRNIQSQTNRAVAHASPFPSPVSGNQSQENRAVASAPPAASASVRAVNPYAGFSGPLVRDSNGQASQTSPESSGVNINSRATQNGNRSVTSYRWTTTEPSAPTQDPGSNPYARFSASDSSRTNYADSRTVEPSVSSNTQSYTQRQSGVSNIQSNNPHATTESVFNPHSTVSNPYANSSHTRQFDSNHIPILNESHTNANSTLPAPSVHTSPPHHPQAVARPRPPASNTQHGENPMTSPGSTGVTGSDHVFPSAHPVSFTSAVNPPVTRATLEAPQRAVNPPVTRATLEVSRPAPQGRRNSPAAENGRLVIYSHQGPSASAARASSPPTSSTIATTSARVAMTTRSSIAPPPPPTASNPYAGFSTASIAQWSAVHPRMEQRSRSASSDAVLSSGAGRARNRVQDNYRMYPSAQSRPHVAAARRTVGTTNTRPIRPVVPSNATPSSTYPTNAYAGFDLAQGQFRGVTPNQNNRTHSNASGNQGNEDYRNTGAVDHRAALDLPPSYDEVMGGRGSRLSSTASSTSHLSAVEGSMSTAVTIATTTPVTLATSFTIEATTTARASTVTTNTTAPISLATNMVPMAPLSLSQSTARQSVTSGNRSPISDPATRRVAAGRPGTGEGGSMALTLSLPIPPGMPGDTGPERPSPPPAYEALFPRENRVLSTTSV